MTNVENDTPVDDDQATETAETATPEGANDEVEQLAEQVAALQQDLLYARAETQNVTRRKDKEIADAHAYASTKFARDIPSVADHLGHALAALSHEQRDRKRVESGWRVAARVDLGGLRSSKT